jgi:hypothetical protein
LSLLVYARECIRSSSVCPSEPIGDRAGWHPGRPRRDRRRARADGRRLMNERDPTKDRRRRRFTPADIRPISSTASATARRLSPTGTGSHKTLPWRRQSGANPSLKWDFRNNARFRGVYSSVTAA